MCIRDSLIDLHCKLLATKQGPVCATALRPGRVVLAPESSAASRPMRTATLSGHGSRTWWMTPSWKGGRSHPFPPFSPGHPPFAGFPSALSFPTLEGRHGAIRAISSCFGDGTPGRRRMSQPTGWPSATAAPSRPSRTRKRSDPRAWEGSITRGRLRPDEEHEPRRHQSNGPPSGRAFRSR